MHQPLLLRILVSIVLATAPARAMAGWDDINVAQMIDDVQALKGKVLSGDIPDTAEDLKRQLTLLQSQGVFLSETVPEILEWLQQRRTPLQDFLRTPAAGSSCAEGSGSQCADFRNRLKAFTQGFAGLRSRFAVIDRLGLGDGGLSTGFVEQAPGFVLFGLYEILNRIPDWERIPGDLADMHDDVGDSDAFSIDWRDESAASARTPTERFCENRANRVDNPIDPVRLNRIKIGVAFLKTAVAAAAEFMPDQLGAAVIGEGGCCLRFPFGPLLKAIASAIDIIANALETFRANLEICRGRERDVAARKREIELHLTSCVALVEYKMQSANDEVYRLVEAKIEESKDHLRTARSETFLASAAASRSENDWGEAYKALCRAYQNLGR